MHDSNSIVPHTVDGIGILPTGKMERRVERQQGAGGEVGDGHVLGQLSRTSYAINGEEAKGSDKGKRNIENKKRRDKTVEGRRKMIRAASTATGGASQLTRTQKYT
jgi:hypothetical protein